MADTKKEKKAIAPKPGTRLRKMFEMLRRAKGCTAEEFNELYGHASGCWVTVHDLADKYGIVVEKRREGPIYRYHPAKPAKAKNTPDTAQAA